MSDENDDEIMDKVKIFSSDDEKLKLLGELLSNKSSRDIIKLLINNEMYTNEIADKLDLRVNLVIHHLKKLEDLGLLQIRNKTITKKGIEHKHYRINSYFFLAPSVISEEIQTKWTLKKIFRDGIKFMVIGIVSFCSWILSYNPPSPVLSQVTKEYNIYEALVPPMLILIIGLIAERIYTGIKKRKK